MINYYTKLYGLLGKNINYTLSPIIHNFAFKKLGINAVYLVFDVNEDKFERVALGLLEMTEGFNITIPYKEKIIQYLNSLDPISKRIASVNTVYKKIGYNTDYLAVKKLVGQEVKELNGENCLIVGAGGAARAVAFALGDLGCRIFIHNRTAERGIKLVDDLKKENIDSKFVNSCDVEYTIIVNSTPNPDFIKEECIKGKLAVEMVYNPLLTSFLLNAKRKGLKTIDGLRILISQALEAEKIWFNKSLSEKEVLDYICQEILLEKCLE